MRLNHLFVKHNIKEIKGFTYTKTRAYITVLFDNGYTGSFNFVENISAGGEVDHMTNLRIPKGKSFISFKVARSGFGWYYLSKLSVYCLKV